jgi:hypothetical protein
LDRPSSRDPSGLAIATTRDMAVRLTLTPSPSGGWCVAREQTYLVRFVGPDAHDRAVKQARELTALFALRDATHRAPGCAHDGIAPTLLSRVARWLFGTRS